MASSRIFVKGLPPSISEDEFKKHFAAKHTITDARLLPHRRIGYVGYKSSEDAATAVKYFNKSFVRMSRIAVEIARPPSDSGLPVSRKSLREQAREAQRAEKVVKATILPGKALLKRKRSDVNESDPKLKEFLEVMRPRAKSKNWIADYAQAQDLEEPPNKVQAIEIDEAKSEDEYEAIPKKPVQKTPLSIPAADTIIVNSISDVERSHFTEPEILDDRPQPDGGLDATDDDWLRSRTNRLLDLVGHTDLSAKTVHERDRQHPTQSDDPHIFADLDARSGQDVTTNEVTQPDITPISQELTAKAIQASGRLFVRNLPYTATEDDLRQHFEKHGALEEVHLPLDSSGISKGFALIQFEDSSAATEAHHNTDGEPFQGRLLHVLPAAAKRDNKLDEFAIAKLPLKKQKLIKKKAEASTSTFNWNSLYMSPDAVNSSIADRLGVSKSELLDPTSADAGVKQAIGETSIIQETKAYFANNGVDLNAFRSQKRGDTAILVKNFPYGTSVEQLRKLFEEFGQVLRLLMPPSGTIAVVEFAQAPQARAAFASLAYRRLQDCVLFLEKAPRDLFTQNHVNDTPPAADKEKSSVNFKVCVTDLLEGRTDSSTADTSTLFVSNLDFSTTSSRLSETFKPLNGFLSARVNTKTDSKKPGQVLSMGFGFVEFRNKVLAHAALNAMDGYNLDGHKLTIKASNKGLDAAEERRKEDSFKKLAGKQTKIIIKNLPFEATKADVRALFGTYGQLRSIRVPKKFDHSTRGFAFADFVTAREAGNAMEALRDTHLLGRRLVLEFAAEDAVDAEEEIEKMQQKVEKQISKVALQKLTRGGRKKFNIQSNDEENGQ